MNEYNALKLLHVWGGMALGACLMMCVDAIVEKRYPTALLALALFFIVLIQILTEKKR